MPLSSRSPRTHLTLAQRHRLQIQIRPSQNANREADRSSTNRIPWWARRRRRRADQGCERAYVLTTGPCRCATANGTSSDRRPPPQLHKPQRSASIGAHGSTPSAYAVKTRCSGRWGNMAILGCRTHMRCPRAPAASAPSSANERRTLHAKRAADTGCLAAARTQGRRGGTCMQGSLKLFNPTVQLSATHYATSDECSAHAPTHARTQARAPCLGACQTMRAAAARPTRDGPRHDALRAVC